MHLAIRGESWVNKAARKSSWGIWMQELKLKGSPQGEKEVEKEGKELKIEGATRTIAWSEYYGAGGTWGYISVCVEYCECKVFGNQEK